jgi:translation initiation factor IF-1
VLAVVGEVDGSDLVGVPLERLSNCPPTLSVPNMNRVVIRPGDDVFVVMREGDRCDLVGVPLERLSNNRHNKYGECAPIKDGLT